MLGSNRYTLFVKREVGSQDPMVHLSTQTSAMPKGNDVIQKPSSEISLDLLMASNPIDDSYVKFIVLVLWMLSHASTPPLQTLERRERPMGEMFPHRLPSPCQESEQTTQKLLFHHNKPENGPRPTVPPEPNAPLYIDIPSILVACRGLGIRGGPKMQRLGQAITHRSQRISRSLRRSYHRGLRPGSDSWPRALKILARAVNCKQDALSSQSLPSHVYAIGSFILKRLAGVTAKDVVDGDQTDFLDLLTLAVNQYASK
jgi:hypothetical protein